MLLSLENKQKIYRSNARLHIFLIQKNGFYINQNGIQKSILRRFLLLSLTYSATATSILLLNGTTGIVNNRNILTDGQVRENT